MGLTSIWHWLILLVVVVAVFGTSKLKNAGKDLGQAVKGFKDAVSDETGKLENAKPAELKAQEIQATEVKTEKDNA